MQQGEIGESHPVRVLTEAAVLHGIGERFDRRLEVEVGGGPAADDEVGARLAVLVLRARGGPQLLRADDDPVELGRVPDRDEAGERTVHGEASRAVAPEPPALPEHLLEVFDRRAVVESRDPIGQVECSLRIRSGREIEDRVGAVTCRQPMTGRGHS